MSMETATACSVESQKNNEIEDDYRLHRRFDRIGRLVGDHGMARLMNASVIVFGLGGVGSFAAESLVRSGVKRIRIVDFDKVCVTNSNRQLQALKNNVGQFKAGVLAERLKLINPQVEVDCREEFYNAENSDEMLEGEWDFVVDAIDNVTAKCHLIATCVERGIPIVVSTGSAGRIDPTKVQVADLADTKVDKLAQVCRQILRQKYDFPREGKKFGVMAVYSEEALTKPHQLTYDRGKGFRCVCPGGGNDFHSCDMRRLIYGTAGFVTGTFGMTAASVVVRSLLEDVKEPAQ